MKYVWANHCFGCHIEFKSDLFKYLKNEFKRSSFLNVHKMVNSHYTII